VPPIAAPLPFAARAVAAERTGASSKIYFRRNPAPIVAMRVVQVTVVRAA
jgi:hypothetical protein